MVAVPMYRRGRSAAADFRRGDDPQNRCAMETISRVDHHACGAVGFYRDGRSSTEPRRCLPRIDSALHSIVLDLALVCSRHRLQAHAGSPLNRNFRGDIAGMGVRCLVCYDLIYFVDNLATICIIVDVYLSELSAFTTKFVVIIVTN